LKRFFGADPSFQLHAHNMRNYFARLLDNYLVAYADILAGDFIGIVQTHPRNLGAGDLDGLEFRHRRESARLPNLDVNIVNLGAPQSPLCMMTQRDLLVVRRSR
jgi:hypothetical protein